MYYTRYLDHQKLLAPGGDYLVTSGDDSGSDLLKGYAENVMHD